MNNHGTEWNQETIVTNKNMPKDPLTSNQSTR